MSRIPNPIPPTLKTLEERRDFIRDRVWSAEERLKRKMLDRPQLVSREYSGMPDYQSLSQKVGEDQGWWSFVSDELHLESKDFGCHPKEPLSQPLEEEQEVVDEVAEYKAVAVDFGS